MAETNKSKAAAALLCFFLGVFGIHRFYLGRIGSGVAQLILFILSSILLWVGVGVVTYLILGIWVVIDFILILVGKLLPKDGAVYKS